MPYRLGMQTEDQARSVLSAARAPLAQAMLAYVTFTLVMNVAYWMTPQAFVSWTMRSVQVDFASLTGIALPLAAVTLTVGIRPVLPRARRIVTWATGLYAVALGLHLLMLAIALAGGELTSGSISRILGAQAGSLVLVNH